MNKYRSDYMYYKTTSKNLPALWQSPRWCHFHRTNRPSTEWSRRAVNTNRIFLANSTCWHIPNRLSGSQKIHELCFCSHTSRGLASLSEWCHCACANGKGRPPVQSTDSSPAIVERPFSTRALWMVFPPLTNKAGHNIGVPVTMIVHVILQINCRVERHSLQWSWRIVHSG